MPHMDRTAELDPAQGQSQCHDGKRDQHQYPEGVHVAEERCLRLHPLADPLNGLLVLVAERAALRHEEVRHFAQGVLILHARRDHVLDHAALMELLAMRQHVGDDRDADSVFRAAFIKAEASSVLAGGMPS